MNDKNENNNNNNEKDQPVRYGVSVKVAGFGQCCELNTLR